jgi:hypothetical protein
MNMIHDDDDADAAARDGGGASTFKTTPSMIG